MRPRTWRSRAVALLAAGVVIGSAGGLWAAHAAGAAGGVGPAQIVLLAGIALLVLGVVTIDRGLAADREREAYGRDAAERDAAAADASPGAASAGTGPGSGDAASALTGVTAVTAEGRRRTARVVAREALWAWDPLGRADERESDPAEYDDVAEAIARRLADGEGPREVAAAVRAALDSGLFGRRSASLADPQGVDATVRALAVVTAAAAVLGR